MIPLSCADFSFPLLPEEAALRLVRLIGIEAVDLALFFGRSQLRAERVRAGSSTEGRRLRSVLAEIGLVPADVFFQTGAAPDVLPANHPDRSVRGQGREMFKLAVEFAQACGCAHLTGLPGVPFGDDPAHDAFHRAAEEAVWRSEAAAQAGIAYAVEAHRGSICPSPAVVLEFLRQAEGVTLTLDYSHFISENLENDSVHPLLPHATHFHARAACPGRLQAPFDRNAVDFAEILRRLRRQAYSGFICLEYVWINRPGCNDIDTLSETIRLRDELARQA